MAERRSFAHENFAATSIAESAFSVFCPYIYQKQRLTFYHKASSKQTIKTCAMNGQHVKNILVKALGEETILSMIPATKCLFEEEQVSKTQFDDIVEGLENYFVDYMQCEIIDQEKVETLQRTVQDLRKLEIHGKDNEKNKTMLVCNSEVFKKTEKPPSQWHPSCLVSLNISFTKSFEIAPDIKNDEANHSVLNMIHKWKGMKSNSAPLVIPIDIKEMEQFILGSLVMFSIYDTSRSKFPLILNGPDSCKKLLQSETNWTDMGECILSSFEISSEKLGAILKTHLENIVNAQSVTQNEGGKLPKRKKIEENLVDEWTERKKTYYTNINKKNK